MGRLRKQGVFGDNLPTKKSKTIEPSDFLIGGLVGFFERRYLISFQTRNTDELKNIFGDNVVSTYYGWDSAQAFFDNVVGVDAKLFVKSHVGNDGSVTDGVVATSSPVDGAAAPLMRIDSAYQTELDYSTYGNNTGYTIENGNRFTTAGKTANIASNTWVDLDSVSDIKIGDMIVIEATGAAPVTVYKIVTGVDEAIGRVSFTGVFHASSNMEVDDVVTIPGFKIHTWRKSLNGIVREVDVELGKSWCTMEDSVTDYYVENVFAVSSKIKVTDLDPATAVGATRLPATVSTVTYLASGANGTAPTTVAHWSFSLSALNDDPVRMIANCETTDETIQKAIETYCQSREDTPKTIYNIPENRTKAQLIKIGNNFQRSDDVLGAITANWLKKKDPFATSPNSPHRSFPNVGAIMGLWIRGIGKLGIHYIPAVSTLPIFGVSGIVGDTFLDKLDRTDLAEAGINVIQFVKGSGTLLKSMFTPSTAKEFQFANGILMREYIKISIVDSLADTENEPNSYDRIQSGRTAIINFMHNLWERGSTGNVPKGETFGQTKDPDTNEASVESDHYQIQADAVNNPQTSIENGERDYDNWFTYPSPAGSIKVGVGLMSLV